MRFTKCSLLWGVVWAVLPSTVLAEIVFSAPPRESVEEGKRVYQPMANVLGVLLGERVIYEQARDWVQYSADMRAGKYDVVFDGPHFAAWRMKHLNHVPLVRLPGPLEFVVVSRWDDKRIRRLRDLASKPVCTLPSPNLGTMVLMTQFDNPLLQPGLHEVRGGFDEMIVALKAGQCRAAVVRDSEYKRLSDADRQALSVIYKSAPFPNQTLTINGRFDAKTRARVAAALTEKNLDAGEGIFNEFSKTDKFFVPAQAADYKDMETMLEGVVWGW